MSLELPTEFLVRYIHEESNERPYLHLDPITGHATYTYRRAATRFSREDALQYADLHPDPVGHPNQDGGWIAVPEFAFERAIALESV